MDSDASVPPTAAEVARDVRVFVSRVTRRLREGATSTDLSPSQTSILSRLLSDGPASVSDLARAEGVRPQSVGATVGQLDSLGLVNGQPDPEDGRRTILSATARAVATASAGGSASTDWLSRRIAQALSADELARVAEAMTLLGRLLEADPATGRRTGDDTECTPQKEKP